MHLHFFFLYALTCYLMHHVLAYHFYTMCSTSLLGFLGFAPTPYCQFVDKALKVVQWAPLGAAVPFLRLYPPHPHAHSS